MNKIKRHQKILELIKIHKIDTQQQLLELLLEDGCDVTQATVSRDIKELRLHKTAQSDGSYKYVSGLSAQSEIASGFDSLLAKAVVSIEYSMNMIVIKTYSGMAQAVCASIDAMDSGDVLGTIAGDDTIFIVTRSEQMSMELSRLIRSKL